MSGKLRERSNGIIIWSREDELWLKYYWTDFPGHIGPNDLQRFNRLKGCYLVFGDHRYPGKIRDFGFSVLDRYENFLATKVSKFARDGELICQVYSFDDDLQDGLNEFAKLYGLLVLKFKSMLEKTDHELEAERKWRQYLYYLARSFEFK